MLALGVARSTPRLSAGDSSCRVRAVRAITAAVLGLVGAALVIIAAWRLAVTLPATAFSCASLRHRSVMWLGVGAAVAAVAVTTYWIFTLVAPARA